MSSYSPFVGSRPFDTADKTIFYGRADEAAVLSKLWRDHRLTILHGPAGVGKTSLLRAGVLPKLGEDPGVKVLPLGRLAFPADFPLAALDLNPFTFALLSSWHPDEPPARISGSSIGDHLAGAMPCRSPSSPPSTRPTCSFVRGPTSEADNASDSSASSSRPPTLSMTCTCSLPFALKTSQS
jgi:hypothetical protein